MIVEKLARFDIQINGETLCTAQIANSLGNNGPAVCSGAGYIMEGE